MTDVLTDAVARLRAAGVDNPRLESRLLWEHAKAPSDFAELLARRAAREPLAYITGHKEFWSLDFEIGPGALVPRPETETLIEETLKAFPDRTAPLRILDLGTGSGCLLVTALTLYPNAVGVGVDCSDVALAWAARNLARHGLGDRASLVSGGWDASAPQRFDCIVCNPPYVAEHEMPSLAPELACEPAGALVAGPDGLAAYRALGPVFLAALSPGGQAFIEIGAGQAADVADLMRDAGLEILGTASDLCGIPRVVQVRRHAAAL